MERIALEKDYYHDVFHISQVEAFLCSAHD